MDQSTSVGQLRKQGNERASLRDNRNLIVRPPEGISTQGLQKNSNPGAFQVSSCTTLINEGNAQSYKPR